MQKLEAEHVVKVLRTFPKGFRSYLSGSRHTIWLAGGYIRSVISNEEPTDIDLFVCAGDFEIEKDKAETLAAESFLLNAIVTNTMNAFTVASSNFLPVQFITRWRYSKVEDLLNSFDFTIAQAAIWYENGVWQSMCSDKFYSSLASKSLVYLSPDRKEDAGGSLLRVL